MKVLEIAAGAGSGQVPLSRNLGLRPGSTQQPLLRKSGIWGGGQKLDPHICCGAPGTVQE